ncbi:hypothetical protein B0I35DRAFT_401028 [Stachybotrys elegans]|uniref:ABC transporter domain-containing protein n=1 Tax=Stachybotrys elegans TaxID=80388 RepID=A0A8K0WLG5_9HYPO|nr:hypothetical protein B0I35DRAFT_401028 [Stachybotrys elegans]
MLWRQVWILCCKNWIITKRRWASTLLRAFLVPILLVVLLCYARNFLSTPATFGIGTSAEVCGLEEALSQVSGGRDRIVFVDNGFGNRDIESVISTVSRQFRSTGISSTTLRRETQLRTECNSSSQGSSRCVAAVIFHSSEGGGWNYTLRADAVLGSSIDVTSSNNDAQVYSLPLQHAIDFAISSIYRPENIPYTIFEYPFTSQTNEERDKSNHAQYMGNIISILGVGFYIAMVGVLYHLTGFMATERESGMSQLLDVMMPDQRAWQPQAARFLSQHLSFSLVYAPGWIIMGIIMGTLAFESTSVVIPLISNLVCGLSLTSLAIFCAVWFREAQLSGITAVIVSLVLAIIAQATRAPSWAVGVLAFLFPPSNYIYLVVTIARWERQNEAASLIEPPPGSGLPIITFWVFAAIHTAALPLLAAVMERKLFGSRSQRRLAPGAPTAVSLEGFSKTYEPQWIQKLQAKITNTSVTPVHAVKGLNLNLSRGEVVVLLGANGSGKSTTLDAVAGMHSATTGSISLSYGDYGTFGHCPQKNVLWDDLTVLEHAKIFQGLKSTITPSLQETKALVQACDLSANISTPSKALSGGQKRKLQLVMMFAGRSTICCVDEVSSGVDPLSRRRLWDILLAERGRRTMLLTTHFLDEADVLADRIAIMADGCLKAHGTSAELKEMTAGYRVHIKKAAPYTYHDIPLVIRDEEIIYLPGSSSSTAPFLRRIEGDGITDYQVHGPTLEEAFLRVVDKSALYNAPTSPHLLEGHPTGAPRQIGILLRKRITIFKRMFMIYLLAIILPIIATCCATIFLSRISAANCDPDMEEMVSTDTVFSEIRLVTGPQAQLSDAALDVLSQASPGAVTYVETIDEFHAEIRSQASSLVPGGFFIGSEPTFAWRADGPLIFSHTVQNVLNNELLNLTIASDFQPLDIPFMGNVGDGLIFTTIFGFAMAVYPAFLTLYPTLERTRGIRSMQYSNGVSALSAWLAHLLFDFLITLVVASVAVIILVAASDVWYHVGYLFLVFVLYGIASTLLCYAISLVAKSQLGAFAVAACVQAGAFLVFFVTYMVILTYSHNNTLTISFYGLGLLSPVCNLARSVYLSLNLFGVTCRGRELAAYPGAIDVFGGPLLYLVLQALLLFSLLWVRESGITLKRMRKPMHDQNSYEMHGSGLEVVGLTKQFKRHLAVDNISFQIPKNECFALLGPNGAGKTTCISMIRGEMLPSVPTSDVLVEGVSALHNLKARAKMGVCPQIDALDKMTVLEHLSFYAQIRGVSKPTYNINTILDSLGLRQYSHRMAESLSGGNKRKLSLGIALIGNPSVLLLDEPSSGMDAASMRLMWRILSSVIPGRSLLLTTHSMEEADALATRAGIVAGRMLASGKTEELRARYGNRYFVHLVHKDAPHTSDAATNLIENWIQGSFPSACLSRSRYGQVRFELQGGQLASVFQEIENGKERVGVQYYNINRATLEQVFLGVLGESE